MAKRITVLIVVLLVGSLTAAHATLMEYQFAGHVTHAFSADTIGGPRADAGSAVTGAFRYDSGWGTSSTTATYFDTSGVGALGIVLPDATGGPISWMSQSDLSVDLLADATHFTLNGADSDSNAGSLTFWFPPTDGSYQPLAATSPTPLDLDTFDSADGWLVFGPDSYGLEITSLSYGSPPVPEPASCALLAFAIGGMGVALKRRRKS